MSGRSSVVESLLPKQVVVGSNPIARSNHASPHLSQPQDHAAHSSVPGGVSSSSTHHDGDIVPIALVKRALIVGLMLTVSACHYYEEYRVLKSTADLQDEKAELLKAYRLCLAKYQDEPPKAKEMCGPYTQSLREIEVRHQSSR